MRYAPLICALLLSPLLGSSLFSEIDQTNFKQDEAQELASQGPVTLFLHADSIGNSDFERKRSIPGIQKEHMRYAEVEAELDCVVYYNACYEEAGVIGIGFSQDHVDWKQNPYFYEDNFNNVSFSFSGTTRRLPGWLWQTRLVMNIDADHFDFNHYTTYDLLLWGRTTTCYNFGYNVGFFMETGMKIDRIWPIVGVDFCWRENWKIFLIYPIKIGVEYSMNDVWSVWLGSRLFNTRHRVADDEPLPEGLWEYTNSGVELGLNYDWCSKITFNIHAGGTLGGMLKISDRKHNNDTHLKFKSAGYGGASFSYNF